MLLRDEELASRIRNAVKNGEQATADLAHASHEANALVSDLNSHQIAEKAVAVMDNLNESLEQVHQLLTEVSQLMRRG